MRIFVVSSTGYGMGIKTSIVKEGHSFECMVGPEQRDLNYLLEQSPPDITLFDSNTFHKIAEQVRTRGTKVLGASSWAAMLESNQTYKDSVIDAIGYKKASPDTTGTRCTIVSWFNGHRFISKYLVFNYRHMMAGDVGTEIDSAGYVGYFKVQQSKLIKDITQPVERFLRKANHRGCFSVDVVCNHTGVFVADINADMHKPYVQALFENTKRHKSDILLDLLNESSGLISTTDPFVCGVLLSRYPYPYTTPEASPVLGVSMGNLRHIWTVDLNEIHDTWVNGNISGCIGYVLARSGSVEEARRRVYRTISNLQVEGLQYRNDIGKDVNMRLYQLRKLNLL